MKSHGTSLGLFNNESAPKVVGSKNGEEGKRTKWYVK